MLLKLCLTAISFLFLLNSCFLLPENQQTSFPPIEEQVEDFEDNGTSDNPIDRRKAARNIDINRFDAGLLEALVHKEINGLRSKKRLSSLQKDNCLRKAAALQNDYVKKKGKLTHNQRNQDRKDVLDRTRVFNCTHLVVGENLQYLGFTLVTRNGKLIDIETPTYAQAAKDIAQNWKNSSGHYENIKHKAFTRVGTAAVYDSKKKGVYVTQVFGATPP